MWGEGHQPSRGVQPKLLVKAMASIIQRRRTNGKRIEELDNNERLETDVVQQFQICIKRQPPRAINHQVDNYYLTLTNL